MNKNSRVFIAGSTSIIGKGLESYFFSKGYRHVFSETLSGINLADHQSVRVFFQKAKPEYVFLAYGASGGILANIEQPAKFIYENLQMQNNIFDASLRSGIKKLLFFASSCIYPVSCRQPIKEDYLLSGSIEKTSQPYAVAKIAGIIMCESYVRQYKMNYLPVVPATPYGPYDNFSTEAGHVIPSLIKKFHDAKIKNKKTVSVWGSGRQRREFLYAEDAVQAAVFLMNMPGQKALINIGCGEDMPVSILASCIKDVVGFKGKIVFDRSKPEGVYQKLLDNAKITRLGWRPKVTLAAGIRKTYDWYKKNAV